MTAVGGPSYQWQLDGAAIAGATASTYDATLAGADRGGRQRLRGDIDTITVECIPRR